MKAFYEYIKESGGLWIVVLLLALFSHGTMLLGRSIGIDTEDIITLQDAFYGEWVSMGRQGLVLLKLLLGTRVFNPAFTGVMTLIFLAGACSLWNYLFYRITGKKNWTASFVFSVLLTVSPLLTEQLYFKLQAMEMTLGFCMMAVSLFLVYHVAIAVGQKNSAGKKNGVYLAVSVTLNIILFSLYQAMVPLFLFGAAACFFLYYFFREKAGADGLRRMGILYPAVFLGSFVLNQVITVVWFSSGSGYLTGQVRWFTQSFKDCLINIYWHVRAVVLGQGLYYSKLYPACCLLLAAIVFVTVRKKQQKFIVRAGGVLSLLLVMAAPFYMTVLCAVEPVMRSQMVMPFALAFVAYAVAVCLEKRRTAARIFLVLCAVAGYVQLRGTMQLNYTDTVRYESDVRIAEAIMDELNALEDSAHSYPVVFVGKHAAELNHSCVKGDTIGYSFFEWDADVEPYGFYNTRRIVGFMHTLGGNYVQGNAEQAVRAAEYSKDMADWPMQGSIVLHDGCIIVRLSDVRSK